MAELPPMMARPSAEAMRRAERQAEEAKRRATRDRRTEYRQAILRSLAERLEAPHDGWTPEQARPDAAAYGLTEAQAAGIRRDMAKVLRHRADAKGGRIRV